MSIFITCFYKWGAAQGLIFLESLFYIKFSHEYNFQNSKGVIPFYGFLSTFKFYNVESYDH